MLTFLRAKEAVWPPRTSRTAIRLRCILLTAMGMKWPRGSGPSINVSFNLITPFRVVPDTTVPTPYKPFNIYHNRILYVYSQLSTQRFNTK